MNEAFEAGLHPNVLWKQGRWIGNAGVWAVYGQTIWASSLPVKVLHLRRPTATLKGRMGSGRMPVFNLASPAVGGGRVAGKRGVDLQTPEGLN